MWIVENDVVIIQIRDFRDSKLPVLKKDALTIYENDKHGPKGTDQRCLTGLFLRGGDCRVQLLAPGLQFSLWHFISHSPLLQFCFDLLPPAWHCWSQYCTVLCMGTWQSTVVITVTALFGVKRMRHRKAADATLLFYFENLDKLFRTVGDNFFKPCFGFQRICNPILQIGKHNRKWGERRHPRALW